MINMELVRERDIDENIVERIKLCHAYLDDVLENPSVFLESPMDVTKHILDLEYKLQELWGFTQDFKFHRYGYRVKWCSCPVMDNDDMVGHTDKRYINVGCPYHGAYPAITWDDARFNE